MLRLVPLLVAAAALVATVPPVSPAAPPAAEAAAQPPSLALAPAPPGNAEALLLAPLPAPVAEPPAAEELAALADTYGPSPFATAAAQPAAEAAAGVQKGEEPLLLAAPAPADDGLGFGPAEDDGLGFAAPAEPLSKEDAQLAAAAAALGPSGDGTAAPQEIPQRSNFSSLISLLDPPPGYAPPQLTPEQQVAAAALRSSPGVRQGTATVHVRQKLGSFEGVQLACGMGYLSTYFVQHFVGLPATMFQPELCGACVRLWCVDSVCEDALVRNATFMVTDSCRDCKESDLLVSAAGLTVLTGVDVGISPKLRIAWAPTSCALLIEGGIRMLASKDNKPDFLSLQFSNLRQRLQAVNVGGVALERTPYGTWEANTPGRTLPLQGPPFALVLVSVDDQRVSTRLPSLRSQDIGANFAA